MKTIDIKGSARNDLSKKETRDNRKADAFPCILYGVNKDEKGLPVATPFTVTNEGLRNLIYTPHIYTVNLDIDGQVCKEVLKDIKNLFLSI